MWQVKSETKSQLIRQPTELEKAISPHRWQKLKQDFKAESKRDQSDNDNWQVKLGSVSSLGLSV